VNIRRLPKEGKRGVRGHAKKGGNHLPEGGGA